MTLSTVKRDFGTASARVQHEIERVEHEIRFAQTLCDLHPEKAPAWRESIGRAVERMARCAGSGQLDPVRDAVREAEAMLAPLGAAAKSCTVHCAGHAHIDMNWMWSWPETVAVTVDTFSTVLRLMEEFPGFLFSQSQASTYEIIERHRPDLLKRIARRVKEGRWEVTASHWVECEKNLAGAEALCRHLLYTRQYMRKLFKLEPEDVPIDWAPDTFGHAATVPTYLARGGVKYAYMHRPGTHTPSRPWLFWWQGPDGSRVLVRNDSNAMHAYNGIVTAENLGREFATFAKETGLRDHLYIYGVGDHGGGPTRRDLLQILDLDAWPIFPNVRFSTLRRYLDLAAQQASGLPVIEGELNYEFTGCYTTQTLIKRDNRFGENRLADAEAAASLAWAAAGLEYPAGDFREGWRDTLFSHFHDILPGSGVHDTRAYTHGLYQKTVAMTAQAETRALRELAARLDTAGAGPAAPSPMPASRLSNSMGAGVGFRAADGAISQSDQSAGEGPRPFLLFNPTASDRREVVLATLWNNGPAGSAPLGSRPFVARAADGVATPAQVVDSGLFWGHEYATLAFPAEIPGLGYSLYTVLEADEPAAPGDPPGGGAWQIGQVHHCRYAAREMSSEGIENEFLRVELNPATGGLLRLTDRRSGEDLVTPGQRAPVLEYLVERPHGMSAWQLDYPGAPVEHPEVKAVRRVLKGPHKASIDVDLKIHESDFTVTYELCAGDPRLHVGIKGVWFQRGTPQTGVPALRFALPLAVADARARYEIPFGAIDRDLRHGEEVPALQWAQVTGTLGNKTAGCLLLNDSKHGHSLDGSTLRLTLIRSSYEPDILPEIGQHEIRLAVLPFAGEMPVEEAIGAGARFNHPVRVVGTDVHGGDLAPAGSFLRVGPAGAALCGVKKAEDGDALVVRVFNPTGQPLTAAIEASRALVGKVASAEEVDLLERPVAKSTARVKANTVTVRLPARGIATVRMTFQGRWRA